MNEQLEQLWQRYRTFPRAIQWAMIAGISIVLFVIWNDYIKSIGDDWALQADRIEQQVRDVRDSTKMEGDFKSLKDTIVSLGEVHVPGQEKDATDALGRIINDIINEYPTITNESYSRASGERMRKGALRGIIGVGEIGKKLTCELKFESSPEIATAILAQFESSPDIEAVTEIRLSHIGNRKVSVKLKLEAWIVARDPKRKM